MIIFCIKDMINGLKKNVALEQQPWLTKQLWSVGSGVHEAPCGVVAMIAFAERMAGLRLPRLNNFFKFSASKFLNSVLE